MQQAENSTDTTAYIVTKSFSLDPVSRFIHLFTYAKTVIQQYGPHTTLPGTNIFVRSGKPRPDAHELPPPKLVATSLAAAQDALPTTQPAGPAKADLQVFKLLWDATTDVLDIAVDARELSQETFEWGVFGLAAGYIFMRSELPVDRQYFLSLKGRLHTALMMLPSLSNSQQRDRENRAKSPTQRLHGLVKTRRETHVCATLLMKKMKDELWDNVRWYHGIAVAERWVYGLGLDE